MIALLIAPVLAAAPQTEGPWEHRQVQTRNLDTHVLVAGPEDGSPVLLIHGFPDSSHGWRGVMPLLAEDHRVYAPDLRGYGGTQRPDDGYELGTLADDVIALLDALELETVDLIGHDWGAAITWEVAAVAPERLDSITVLNIPHPTALYDAFQQVPEQRKYKKFANLMKLRFTARVLSNVAQDERGEKLYFPELVDDSAFSATDAAQYHALFDELDETRAALAYYRTNFASWRATWEKAQAHPKIDLPTLVLWGAQDNYMLASEAERSCGYVNKTCSAHVHPDAGHWLLWEQPEWVVERWRAAYAPAQ